MVSLSVVALVFGAESLTQEEDEKLEEDIIETKQIAKDLGSDMWYDVEGIMRKFEAVHKARTRNMSRRNRTRQLEMIQKFNQLTGKNLTFGAGNVTVDRIQQRQEKQQHLMALNW